MKSVVAILKKKSETGLKEMISVVRFWNRKIR
jgi:hypothetical protein